MGDGCKETKSEMQKTRIIQKKEIGKLIRCRLLS